MHIYIHKYTYNCVSRPLANLLKLSHISDYITDTLYWFPGEDRINLYRFSSSDGPHGRQRTNIDQEDSCSILKSTVLLHSLLFAEMYINCRQFYTFSCLVFISKRLEQSAVSTFVMLKLTLFSKHLQTVLFSSVLMFITLCIV